MATSLTRILVPTDFSETADAALAYGKDLAERLGASLHLVHVFSDPHTLAMYAPDVYAPMPLDYCDKALCDAREELARRLDSDEARRWHGTTAVVAGLTAKEIVRYASDHAIDLIVMGTHGRRGVAHLLLGSVAEHVVRIAQCPVLTVQSSSAQKAKHPAAA